MHLKNLQTFVLMGHSVWCSLSYLDSGWCSDQFYKASWFVSACKM